MCARVGVRESRRSMKRTRCRCSGRGMYNFFRAPASESGVVSRRVFSEITCWIACDLFHDGRRIPAIFSFPFSQLPSRSFTHKLDAYRETQRERERESEWDLFLWGNVGTLREWVENCLLQWVGGEVCQAVTGDSFLPLTGCQIPAKNWPVALRRWVSEISDFDWLSFGKYVSTLGIF